MNIRPVALLFSAVCLSGCYSSDGPSFQGYVEGEYVYLASARAGRLEQLLTSRGESVTAGAVLCELEAGYEQHALRQAEQEMLVAVARLDDMESGSRPEEVAMATARLEQARAEAANAADQLRRNESLIAGGGISRRELDDSRAAARAADARVTELARQVDVFNLPEREKKREAQQATVRAAEARVDQARWERDQKRLQAPESGLVYDTLYHEGEWVPAGSPIIQLLPPDNIKIRFFVPEAMLAEIRHGGSVLFHVDGHAEALRADIRYISPRAEYTPPVIYSNETRSKLVFMVEARPASEALVFLHPGQPVSVRLP